MRFGTLLRGSTIEEITTNLAASRDDGFSSAWLTDGYGYEPLTALAVAGQTVGGIEVGTAVVRTLLRHPAALAQHAMTANAAVHGRLVLGVGPSHGPPMRRAWGIEFERPIRAMREYLEIVGQVVRGNAADFDGEMYRSHVQMYIEPRLALPVLVGALGPQMVALAGAHADGVISYLVGPRTLTGMTCPVAARAAEAADRPAPRIVAMISVCVTDDIAEAERRYDRINGEQLKLPSYAAAAAREGARALLVGSESEVEEAVAGLFTAGVTDLVALPIARRSSNDEARTNEFLARLRRN